MEQNVMKLYTGGIKNRQKRALERLENQLKAGTKTEKVNQLTKVTTGPNQIPLSEADINRINKEIQILKTKL